MALRRVAGEAIAATDSPRQCRAHEPESDNRNVTHDLATIPFRDDYAGGDAMKSWMRRAVADYRIRCGSETLSDHCPIAITLDVPWGVSCGTIDE
jgi:hypothetical protein